MSPPSWMKSLHWQAPVQSLTAFWKWLCWVCTMESGSSRDFFRVRRPWIAPLDLCNYTLYHLIMYTLYITCFHKNLYWLLYHLIMYTLYITCFHNNLHLLIAVPSAFLHTVHYMFSQQPLLIALSVPTVTCNNVMESVLWHIYLTLYLDVRYTYG